MDSEKLAKANAAVASLTGELVRLKYELKSTKAERDRLRHRLEDQNDDNRGEDDRSKDVESNEGSSSDNGARKRSSSEAQYALKMLSEAEKENERLQSELQTLRVTNSLLAKKASAVSLSGTSSSSSSIPILPKESTEKDEGGGGAGGGGKRKGACETKETKEKKKEEEEVEELLDPILDTMSRQLESAQAAKHKLEARVQFLEENLRLTNAELMAQRAKTKELTGLLEAKREKGHSSTQASSSLSISSSPAKPAHHLPGPNDASSLASKTSPSQPTAESSSSSALPALLPFLRLASPSSSSPTPSDLQQVVRKLETVVEEKTLEAMQLKETLIKQTSQRTQMRRLITRAKDRLRLQEERIRTLLNEKMVLEKTLGQVKREARSQILQMKRAEAEAKRESASLREFYANAASGRGSSEPKTLPAGASSSIATSSTPPMIEDPVLATGGSGGGFRAKSATTASTCRGASFATPSKPVKDLHDWGSPSTVTETPASSSPSQSRSTSPGFGDWLGTAISSATTAIVKMVEENKGATSSFGRPQSVPSFMNGGGAYDSSCRHSSNHGTQQGIQKQQRGLANGVRPNQAKHNPFAAFLAGQTANSKAHKLISALSGNDACADCGRPNPEWAVYNTGVVVCLQCSGCHRDLGVAVSKVRSLSLDTWPEDSLQIFLKMGGNKTVNGYLEAKLDRKLKPQPSSARSIRQRFIAEKYEHRAYFSEEAKTVVKEDDEAVVPDPENAKGEDEVIVEVVQDGEKNVGLEEIQTQSAESDDAGGKDGLVDSGEGGQGSNNDSLPTLVTIVDELP